MAVIVDTVRVIPAGLAIRKRRIGRTSPSCESRTGSGSRRRFRWLCRDTRHRARERSAHCLRRGRLSQYRRVLGTEARDVHDHGGHLHARVRLLQRQDRMPAALDPDEPEHVANATAKLGLSHVVITSVDRDDLDDGGAAHFAAVIRAIRARCRQTTIEVLTPDFCARPARSRPLSRQGPMCSTTISKPCRRTISPCVRARAISRRSSCCSAPKSSIRSIFTKSGIMVGLGEERNEVLQVMDDLRAAEVDFLTIGQYLQPSRKHHPVIRFVPPDEFNALTTIAYAKGFSTVSASPLTRSSHHAGEDFARLKARRAAAR